MGDQFLRRVAAASLMLAALHPVGAVAQSTEPATAIQTLIEQVPDLLRSDDYKQIAWGAYFAGQYRVAEAIPLLQETLERIEVDDPSLGLIAGREDEQIERMATTLSVLDALMQLNARVPAPSVERFFDRWPIQTLVLVGNAVSGRDDALLSLLERGVGTTWTAVANMLLETKPPVFAARLLNGLHLYVQVRVVSKENGISDGFGSGSGEGCNYAVSAPGYPPIAEYGFSTQRPGATILAVGPHPTFYIRRLSTRPSFRPCTGWRPRSRVPNDQERLDYLRALIADRVETGRMLATTYATVVWTGPTDFVRRIAELRRNRERELQDLIGLLIFTGRLTRDESRTFPAAVDITVLDRRDDQSEPLPPVNADQR